MRRQIRLTSAIGLLILALVMGLSGGLAMGGVFGYWYGHQRASSANASTIQASSALNPSTSQQSDVPAQAIHEIPRREPAA